MRLINKIRFKLADRGLIALKNAPAELKENAEFVTKVLQTRGAEEFLYAGDCLRSDADYILSRVYDMPEILAYCAEVIYDWYMEDIDTFVGQPVDLTVFTAQCCEKNELAIEYLPINAAIEYYETAVINGTVVGTYHGKRYEKKLNVSDTGIAYMLLVRPEIGKCTDLTRSSMEI